MFNKKTKLKLTDFECNLSINFLTDFTFKPFKIIRYAQNDNLILALMF